MRRLVEGMGLRSLDSNPEDEETTMDNAKAAFKVYYDEIMDRCTDWYKRSVHISLIAIGMVLAVAFDADTFKIFNSLHRQSRRPTGVDGPGRIFCFQQ